MSAPDALSDQAGLTGRGKGSVAGMARALVLNASYEPLEIVSGRRAVVLVLGDKAELVHDSGIEMHAAHLCVAVPSVIRLRRYVRIPHRRLAGFSRRAVLARDAFRCQYCNKPAESIDHVVPRSRGGTHSWDNVVAACHGCNRAKRDRLLAETSMQLRCHPRPPGELSRLRWSMDPLPQHWEAYLSPALSA